ncbi:Autophagy-related protein 2 [Seminavis robusta]|uniref:Autophagy-related protein 2 n=1 Tax=Seminavis robusta TaxID=568900 RepID=A0A9N8H4B1_9STRA|nr:Autophagy-related protein 2 [Seminavis robusta]|eukprot:Sro58_g033560.1 Autophagy-related protein 2 (1868) ;mRNA; f:8761-14683
MIKWKQRLYALLLRQVVGPLLDSESQEKLHESIDVSFQEGTFVLSNVSLCTAYLNNFDIGPLYVKKARVGSLAISLSLVEGQASENATSSSIAWRAMNLGSTVALVAQIEIDGLQLELEPRQKSTAAEIAATSSHHSLNSSDSDTETAPQKSTLSSYIDAAMSSLQLTLNLTNCSFRISQPNGCGGDHATPTTTWIELSLPSLSYQDIDPTESSPQQRQQEQSSTTQKILQKSVTWQGISLAAGEYSVALDGTLFQDPNLVTTMALAEGTGQILLRAVEYKSDTTASKRKPAAARVQQDVDVRLNQQIKVSLDETTLRQIQSVLDGFVANADEGDNTTLQREESVESMVSQAGGHHQTGLEGMELYSIDGIMKQYQEARMLAARNEMRGGMLLPSNDEGDSRTFDMFFDANDKSFSHYASMMKESMLASREGGPSDSFVHTKIRIHVLGSALKLGFRNRSSEAAPYLGPEEYILMTFDEISATSSLSHKRSEFALHISHLEIDDSQTQYHDKMQAAEGRKAEIGTLLSFTQADDIVQPACISFQLDVDTDPSGNKVHNLELNLMPIEMTYRHRTVSNITALISSLGNSSRKNNNQQLNPTEQTNSSAVTALCTISSLTLTIPALCESDFSPLYARCGHYSVGSASTCSAIGFVIEDITLEHESGDNTADKDGAAADPCTSLECQSILVFASTPESPGVPVGRNNRVDIFAAFGRFEVEPHIPIVLQYRQVNDTKEASERSNAVKAMFPTVPLFSSFKARQEDEDEDEAIDQILSNQLRNVDVDSRQTLRAKDPQDEMISEAEKAVALVKIHIPEIVLDLSRDELCAVQNLLSCCFPSTMNESSGDHDSAEEHSSSSLSIAVSVACDSISCSLVDRGTSGGTEEWRSHLLKLDRCRAHVTTGDGTTQCLRVLSHETTMFELVNMLPSWCSGREVDCIQDRVRSLKLRATTTPRASTEPILYRSKIFPAISPSSPSILLDFLRAKPACEGVEQSVFFSVYNLTHRFNPDSKWLDNLMKFISAIDPTPEPNEQRTVDPMVDCQSSSLTKVFATLMDCNVDYTSLPRFSTASRSILRVGDVRFSSNILTPAGSVQAYNVSVGDLSWQLCNTRCSYNLENSLLPGSALIMSPSFLSFNPQQSTGTSTDYTFRMGFKTLVTLDSIRAVIVKRNPKANNNGLETGVEPPLTTSLALGEVSLYACKDSFECFTSSIGELETLLTSLTSEEMEELRASSSAVLADPHYKGVVHNRKPAQTVSVDAGSKFLLDGYDWTTIDHDGRTDILPGEEQTARWYHAPTPSPVAATSFSPQSSIVEVTNYESQSSRCDPAILNSINESYAPKIIDHHFPLQLTDIEVAQCAGSKSVAVASRVLVHDLKVKIRLFDGYDWPQYQRRRKLDPNALFVIEEPPGKDPEGAGQLADRGGEGKTNHLEGLLGGPNDATDTFADMPLPEERAVSLLAQNEIRTFGRRTNSYIQIVADGISARVDAYESSKEHRMKSSVQCSLKDFFLAETISSMNPVKLIGEWFNETEHPRDSRDGLLMLKMFTWDPQPPITDDGALANEESEVVVTMAPVRCIIDQRAIKFIKAFFGDSDESEDDSTSRPEWAEGLSFIPPPFLRVFRMNSVKLKIDYTPQTLDTAALKNGSVVELINLSPLDAMVLTLAQVEIKEVLGFGDAVDGLVSSWLGDICATQMHKFLTNARPFEPFTNVGGGVADLFVLPWDAYQNGDSVSRALRSSVSSLVGTVAHETLTQASRMLHSAGNKSHSSLPSRPLRTPKRVGDTTRHALESLASGVQAANYKVIIVPYREYRRGSTTGAIKSVVKGIPVAIAAPVGGVSESVSYALLGLRNQVRPDLRKEEEASKRGLHYGGI